MSENVMIDRSTKVQRSTEASVNKPCLVAFTIQQAVLFRIRGRI